MRTERVRGPGVCRIIVLGSTGSIGTQTLEVIEHLGHLHAAGHWPTRYEVVGLAAGTRSALVQEQCVRLNVRHTALAEGPASSATFVGPDAAEQLVRNIECDMVVAAITGAAWLPATLAAVELGRDIALANKETLVAAGALIIPAAQRSGSRLFPVDSEHSALWQCLAGSDGGGSAGAASPAPSPPPLRPGALPSVRRVILTASGGPFRLWSREQIERATPEQALRHPTWNMGPKVTVDCASLTNKGFEVIEAHWLFGLRADQIEVVIHPQSIVHSLVEYADGSTIAQLGSPDMRGPIQYAMTCGGRPSGLARPLDWRELRLLEFEPPDLERFPALELACSVIRDGTPPLAGAVFNAASEAAVQAFLAGQIPFGRIPQLARGAMEAIPADLAAVTTIASLDDVLRADREARRFVAANLGEYKR
jgi:1-deoxy-D-xylulose-5-phosphate reductoisomerase